VCSEPTQEMERSADVLSAGLLEVANPSLSSRYFLKQVYLLYETPATFYFMSHTSYIFSFYTGFTVNLIVFFYATGSIGLMDKMMSKIL
jgi:hypothetical protein